MTINVEIKDAASVILIRNKKSNPSVLMGQRGKDAAFMPNKFVFPGGAVDPIDADVKLLSQPNEICLNRLKEHSNINPSHAFLTSAIREIWEETGLMFGEKIYKKFNSPDNEYGYGILNASAAINYQFTTSIKDETFLPDVIFVENAYPNPFNPEVSIKINGLSNSQHVSVGVYDLHGTLVTSLHNQKVRHNVLMLTWNAEIFSSGIYLLRTDWQYGNDTQKITLLK